MGYLLNSRLGSRSRFQSLIEQSRFSHRVLSTSWPGESDQANRRENGSNWQIDALSGDLLLSARGAFYLTWFILRAQIGLTVKQCGAQAIHAHNPTLLSLAAADIARWLHLPFVFETHGLSGTATQVDQQAAKKIRPNERILVQQADKVIVQTRTMKKSLEDLYGTASEKIVILPNFVDTTRFDPTRWKTEGCQLRQKWGLAEDERVFLYSGFINWYNGIPELLSAFAAAHFERPTRLVICGDGNQVDLVRKAEQASPNPIRYVGILDKDEMPAVYAASDCLVLARPDVAETREATPMKLLEAMSMEKLVLCSRVAGMTEVADDQTAVLFNSGDVIELRQCLKSISQDLPRYTHLGTNARAKVNQKFTADAAGRILDFAYKELGCKL